MNIRLSAALLIFAAMTACSKDKSAVPTANAAQRNGAPGGAGARRGPTVTLGPTDVDVVRTGTIEDAVAITGNLNPLETVVVRARLEGDILGVYVREGQRVGAGQLLARYDAVTQEGSIASANAAVQSAKGTLQTAEWNLTQTKQLYDAGAVSEQDYRIAQQAVLTAQAQLAAAEATRRNASQDVTDTRVTAPADGVIGTRDVSPGEHVTRGASLFTLVRSAVLELAAAVPARDANRVATGQPVRFTADGKSFTGRVDRVSPTIDPASRTVTVYIDVPNASGALKGGTFASGRVIAHSVDGQLIVPVAAVRQSQKEEGSFVYTIVNGQVAVAPVQLGIIDQTLGIAQVLKGVKAGDKVIVGNVGALGRGMAVEILGGDDAAPSR